MLLLLAAALLGSLTAHADETPAPAWPALEWKKVTPSPFARTEAATALVDGKLYLFGGFIAKLETSSQVDVYEPATDAWSRKKEGHADAADPCQPGRGWPLRVAGRRLPR
jgi:hypothetical protein